MPTPSIYPQWVLGQHNGDPTDLDTDALRMIFLNGTHAFNAAHDFVSDIIANQVSGTGYTAGGMPISGVTLALDGTTLEFAFNDVVIAQDAGGFTNAEHVVLAEATGNDATSRVIFSMALGAASGNVSGPLTIDVDPASGAIRWPLS